MWRSQSSRVFLGSVCLALYWCACSGAVSNGGNNISGNTFTGLASGVYIDLCKKFITSNNSITGNTFTGNGLGVYQAVNTDGGQCVSSTTEGSNGWVTGAGRIDGLVVSGNNFLGNTTAGLYSSTSNWATQTANAPVSTGPISVTCNYWNSASGPTIATNPGGAGDAITILGPNQPAFTFSPWRTAAAPGGACDGA